MDRGAICNSLVRVQGTIQRRFLRVVEERQQLLSDARHARRAADEHDFVDVLRVDFCVLEDPLDRSYGPVKQWIAQALEFRSRDVQGEVLAFVQGIDIYTRFRRRRQLPLRAVAGEVEAPPCFCVEPGRVWATFFVIK
mmetsp:Transcript_2137/g.5982  ORF Transcript_2137/g.5982 Transcript_2137/m.5982 type:complete len:138 (-) Transcript_2137:1072-1485(-)